MRGPFALKVGSQYPREKRERKKNKRTVVCVKRTRARATVVLLSEEAHPLGWQFLPPPTLFHPDFSRLYPPSLLPRRGSCFLHRKSAERSAEHVQYDSGAHSKLPRREPQDYDKYYVYIRPPGFYTDSCSVPSPTGCLLWKGYITIIVTSTLPSSSRRDTLA